MHETGMLGATQGDALPFGWIGARDLPTLTLHLRGLAGDARIPLGDMAEALFAVDDESRALIDADRARFFRIVTGGGLSGRGRVDHRPDIPRCTVPGSL